jgi:hypothetical protein
MRPFHKLACLAALALLSPAAAAAQTAAPPPKVTAPEAFFEQPPGTDYFLADYTAYEAYLKRLASESDRMKLVDIGRTAEGRTQWMAIVSSPANVARLDHYKSIAERLARARLSEDQARALASEGKAVVWIDDPERSGDDADPERHHRSVRSRQSGRNGTRQRLVHAPLGPEEARVRDDPPPLPEICGAR